MKAFVILAAAIVASGRFQQFGEMTGTNFIGFSQNQGAGPSGKVPIVGPNGGIGGFQGSSYDLPLSHTNVLKGVGQYYGKGFAPAKTAQVQPVGKVNVKAQQDNKRFVGKVTRK